MKTLRTIAAAILAMTCSDSFALAPLPQTISQISSAQGSYSFSNWQSPMSCTINDNGRIIFIQASAAPTPVITFYDSITAAAALTANYRGTWTPGSYPNPASPGSSIPIDTYSPPTVSFSNISATPSSGGYAFSISTSSGTHNIVLFPSGFYVSKTNSLLYIPGC